MPAQFPSVWYMGKEKSHLTIWPQYFSPLTGLVRGEKYPGPVAQSISVCIWTFTHPGALCQPSLRTSHLPCCCSTWWEEQLIRSAVPAGHESAVTFPGSLHSARCHSEHWYSIQKPSLISREDFSSYAFYSGASDYTESLPGCRESSELLGSWSLTADSASPVSGGADKGHMDGHCRIGKFPKALNSFRRCCWWFRR